MIGSSLGPYKIIEQLGAGGMGEVYLGEDTRLGRKVAIKVLPAEFASDPERLARFEQEARAAAALNHPHIAVVHDIGTEGDIHFMVQEYLEGQSLRERLDKGALPLDAALDLAIEVSEALIAAHKAGIIHRDLKPDNIFVTEEGHAKVLDFGLAKLTEVAAPRGSEVTASPTMLGTVAGQIMGTAGYMAPEQVQGGEVDGRTDLFAFGCVLYESVAGRQAFQGRTIHQTLDLIVSEDPRPIGEVRPDAPTDLHRVLRKCFAKDAGRRYQDADDLVVDLRMLQDDIATGVAGPAGAQDPAPETGVPATGERSVTWATVGLIAIATAVSTGAIVWGLTRGQMPVPRARVRFEIPLPVGVRFPGGGNVLAISPDGNSLVFLGRNEEVGPQLYLWRFDQLGATPIPGTERANRPFFSPDSESVAFNADGDLMRVELAGGQMLTLCEDCTDGASSGTWSPSGEFIVFAYDGSFRRIPAGGGTPTRIAEPDPERDEAFYTRPEFLPDGNAILFELRRGGVEPADAAIAVLDIASGNVVSIVAEEGTDPQYAATGHVLYARGTSLYGIAFDPVSKQPIGQPTPVVSDLWIYRPGWGQFGIARNGTLVFIPRIEAEAASRSLVWVDRAGTVQRATSQKRMYDVLTVSPADGERVAVSIVDQDGGFDIWVVDLQQDTVRRLTTRGARYPTWTRDGTRIAFGTGQPSEVREGELGIYSRASDFSDLAQEPRLILRSDVAASPGDWPPDAKTLVLRRTDLPDRNIFSLAVDDDAASSLTPLVSNPVDEYSPRLSPDGDWLVYVSQWSGAAEVYAQPFRGPGGAVEQISTDGGSQPIWAPDGSAIYYRDRESLVEAQLEYQPDLRVVGRDRLFPDEFRFGEGWRQRYDVHPDGQRFLMIQEEQPEADAAQDPRINVVLNWFEELKERVPTGGR